MRVQCKAGKFEIQAFTDGSPQWTSIKRGDVEFRIHPQELADLEYAVAQFRVRLRAAISYLPDKEAI